MQTQASSKTAPPAGGFAHPRRNVAALGIEPGMLVADFGSGSGAYTLAIDKGALLAEARRILKATGRLAIVDWSESFERDEGAREGVGKRKFPVSEGSSRSERWKTEGFQRGWGPTEEDVIAKDAALELARKAGFELVKEFPAGAHHYGLIMRPVAVAK